MNGSSGRRQAPQGSHRLRPASSHVNRERQRKIPGYPEFREEDFLCERLIDPGHKAVQAHFADADEVGIRHPLRHLVA